jgi:hypothetical protein
LSTGVIVNRCYASGSVTSYSGAGGFVGNIYAVTISDCYATGHVSISSYQIGGFFGFSQSGTVFNRCYATGLITGSSTAGGFGGYAESPSISSCFWDTQTSTKGSAIGSLYGSLGGSATLTGKTTTEMKTSSTYSGSGWDFTTVWQMIGTNYPDLRANSNSALPVELTSFGASVIGSTIKLNWQTATELNNYGFEIERKVGSSQSSVGNYEKIGFVNGNGNSNSPKSYSFVDDNVSAGRYSYRLKQIDNDGQYEYSKTIEVDLGTPSKFELSQNYPNPFNPATTIQYIIPQTGNVKLILYNILGQEVKTLINEMKEAGTYTINFNASELNSGMYLYKIESNGFTQTRKMTLLK